MKAAVFAVLLTVSQLTASAADTAYAALRVIGKRDGKEVLNRVVEVRGRNGTPQPEVWKIVIDEARARGGIREIEVQRGKIIGERTPTSRAVGAPMNFGQLNLDSEGAFTVANQAAEKAAIPFDHVDYILRSGTGGGAPVWELILSEGKTRAGVIEVAADSGAVLRQQMNRAPLAAAPRPTDDRAYLDDRRVPPPSAGYDDDRYSRSGEPFRSVPDFFHRLGQRFQKRSRQMENFFTGKEPVDSRTGAER